MSEEAGFAATIVLGLCGIIFDPLGGILSDRFGRRPMMIIPWAILLLIPGSVVVGVLAAVVPAWRARRQRVSELLRVE
jgi:MFS family permease